MTQNISDHRITMEHKFRLLLSMLLADHKNGILIMRYNDVDFAITKNTDTYSPYSMTKASFQPVGSNDDKAIIVYVTDCEAGFGLYDEDKEACFPIDVHEVVYTWVDESAPFQRNMLAIINGEIEGLLRTP